MSENSPSPVNSSPAGPPVAGRPVAVYTDAEDTDVTAGIRILEDAGFTVRVLGTRDPLEIIAGAQDAEVVLPGYAPITREVIEGLPKLKIVALMSMGFDYVDLDAATERGVWVTNIPGAATEEVATHTLTLILASIRQLRFYLGSANPKEWNERSAIPPRRLSELTLGIIGVGRIGREFARLARPLFGRILGYDPLLPETEDTRAALEASGIERRSLDEVRSASDVLSLHLPLTDETQGMVDADFLAELASGALLVNVSRGGLIDSQAVAESLDAGRLAGVAVDVLDEEPPSSHHPLLGRDDVVLTPHIAYFSDRTEAEYVRIQAENAITFATVGRPDSPVNNPQP